MEIHDHLITSGCSFSEVRDINTWPYYIQQYYNVSANHYGTGSQGNGLISRKVHWAIEQHKDISLLVMVMWSHPSRHEFYDSNQSNLTYHKYSANFIPGVTNGSWGIINKGWQRHTRRQRGLARHDTITIEKCKAFYKSTYDEVYMEILTLEHILRLQTYLKFNKINYVFMKYTDQVFAFEDNPECSWLYRQLDFDNFIEQSCFEWCRDHSGIDMPTEQDIHPSTQQHERYAHDVIVPHLARVYN
tara:strand:+ start:2299 stop:3033 length:735 start_codon:yes stop_codon:yes gene_type:complete